MCRNLGSTPTTAQHLDLVKRRLRLRRHLDTFIQKSRNFLGIDIVEGILFKQTIGVIDDDAEETDQFGIPLPAPTGSLADPENQPLPFPSIITEKMFNELVIEDQKKITRLKKKELEIRIGHAEDCLELVCSAIIQASWLYKNGVRVTEGTMNSRATTRATIVSKIWKHHRQVYNYNRSIMITLGDSDLGTTYPILQLSECTVSTAITDPNSRQSRQRLPWFWSAARPGTVEGDEDARFVECK